MKNEMIRIPVSATMRRNVDGSYSMIDADYREITADFFARFLIEKFGITAVPAEEGAID